MKFWEKELITQHMYFEGRLANENRSLNNAVSVTVLVSNLIPKHVQPSMKVKIVDSLG